MKILLDFEGVLITFPTWQPAKTAADGFLAFDETSVKNLNRIISELQVATLVLTTTHRIAYPVEKWESIFAGRGISIERIEKINERNSLEILQPRHIEIIAWAGNHDPSSYIILDDDAGLHQLPDEIKRRWVKTDLMRGFDDGKLQEAMEKAGVNSK